MKRMDKHIAALAALLVFLLAGWAAASPMNVGMNPFGVVLGAIMLPLFFVASVVVALYFTGQGRKGLGRVIAVGVAFAAALLVADVLFSMIQPLLVVEGGVPEALAGGACALLRCAAWVFFFWLAISRLTRKEDAASESSSPATRTAVLVVAGILAMFHVQVYYLMLPPYPLLPAFIDALGLIVWWFLAVACIWRFSFGVVAGKIHE